MTVLVVKSGLILRKHRIEPELLLYSVWDEHHSRSLIAEQ